MLLRKQQKKFPNYQSQTNECLHNVYERAAFGNDCNNGIAKPSIKQNIATNTPEYCHSMLSVSTHALSFVQTVELRLSATLIGNRRTTQS